MKRHLLVVPLAIFGSLAASVGAQGGTTETPAPSRVDKRAQQMRDEIDNGKQVLSHVRVSVRLKNGNKLNGIVKDGRFVERVDGLRFVEAQAKESGAGIRLWYSGGARNYVFIPFVDFAHYEVLQRLSAKQLEEIEVEMQMNERRAAERAAAAKAAQSAATGAETPATDGGEAPMPAGESVPAGADAAKAKAGKTVELKEEDKAAAAAQEQQRLWFRLVNDYPPAAGWGQKKCDEIKRRKVVIGATPSATEQFFADNFAQWLQACAHFGVSTEAKPKEGDAETEEAGNGKRDRRRKK